MKETSNTYFNPVQMRSYLLYSNQEILIAGRGTGKSSGIIAPRIKRWCEEMPRCTIIGEAATYQQHFSRTLPEIFAGLAKLGWHEGQHYWVGKYAPAKLKIDRPLTKPLKTEYMIHTHTGASIVLVSHDRPGSANGLSAQARFGDEAKFLNRDKHKNEVNPAIRGNSHIFGDAACYGASLLTSDMPVGAKSQWLIEDGEINHNQERMDEIMVLQLEVNKLLLKIHQGGLTDGTVRVYSERIVQYNKLLTKLRAGDPENGMSASFLYHEASSLENISVLTPAYFDKMRATLSPLEYNTSILNHRVKQVKDGFYDLDEDFHGYTAFNNEYLDSFGYDKSKYDDADSRQDADVNTNQPLDIAMDYGGNFNCLVVGQVGDDEYKFLHGFHVKHPMKISDVVLQFKRYYRYHKRKEVRFFYDHTATATNALIDLNYYTEVMAILGNSEHGQWTVHANYIGATPTPMFRHQLWSQILSSSNKILPFRYNKIHCEYWSISCMLAPVKTTSKGLEKDKSSERSQAVSQERATHYSDAGDTLAVGAIAPLLSLGSSSSEGW
jgi:hypothetical protein